MTRAITTRKSGFIQRDGRTVRKTTWFANNFFDVTVAAGTPQILSSLNAAALALAPFTIVRTRGVLLISSDQEAIDEDQKLIYAMAVVSTEAVATGVAAVPTPITESGSNLFFVFQPMVSDFRFGSATSWTQTNQQQEIDSKAMRKVEQGQDVIEVIECLGTGVDALGFVKMLIKLH